MSPNFDPEQFERDGFSVVRQAVDVDLLREVANEWTFFQTRDVSSVVPKDAPVAVFWRHLPGQRKRTRPLREFPALESLALSPATAEIVRMINRFRGVREDEELRLLETIIFDKPPAASPLLNWHQDNSFFPFTPNNQAALWIPLDPVDASNGTLRYVVGTHKLGLRASTDLHSGRPFERDQRPAIPADPIEAGYETRDMVLEPGDLSVHDGLTWHCSLPNVSPDRPRRALSLRYLMGSTTYTPNEGTAAAFVEQVDVRPGERVAGPAFPLIPHYAA